MPLLRDLCHAWIHSAEVPAVRARVLWWRVPRRRVEEAVEPRAGRDIARAPAADEALLRRAVTVPPVLVVALALAVVVVNARRGERAVLAHERHKRVRARAHGK